MLFIEKFRKIVNTKIGKWTILDKEPTIESGSYRVHCRCDCSYEKLVNFYSLINGDSSSCLKCRVYSAKPFERWKKENGPPNIKPVGEAAFHRLYNRYKFSAKSKNIEFAINKEQLRALTKANCHYCGKIPQDICGGVEFNGDYVYNGVDRKNNKSGYTIENCLTCCKDCNFLKKDRDYDDFLSLIHKISENLKNEKKS